MNATMLIAELKNRVDLRKNVTHWETIPARKAQLVDFPQELHPAYKSKHHYNTKWAKDGFKIHGNGKIELSMGIHNGKREKPIVLHTKKGKKIPAIQVSRKGNPSA